MVCSLYGESEGYHQRSWSSFLLATLCGEVHFNQGTANAVQGGGQECALAAARPC